MKTTIKRFFLFTLTLALVLSFLPSTASAKTVTEDWELITSGASGLGGNDNSERPSISADGRYIVFQSTATDLIPGLVANGNRNIFLYDRSNGATKLISTGASGLGGNNDSRYPDISADGRRITFSSMATDLVPGISASNNSNAYLYDIETSVTTLVTPGSTGQGVFDGWVGNPMISGNGSKIAFTSGSTEIVSYPIHPGRVNLFIYDVASGVTTLASKGPDGLGVDGGFNFPAISYDGTKVVIETGSSDIIPGLTLTGYYANVVMYDIPSDTMSLITKGPLGMGIGPSYSGGYSNNVSISADNNLITFTSWATDVIDGLDPLGDGSTGNLYLYNVATDETKLITAGSSGIGGDQSSYGMDISDDGSVIGFISAATDLIPGLTTSGLNVFHYDIATGETSLVTAGLSGEGGDGGSNRPSLSAYGSIFAFHSSATDLIPGLETSSQRQIYVYIRTPFCDITFDPGNGSAPWTDLAVENCLATKPTDPSRDGHIFTGWWTAPTGGTLWNFSDRATDDITLYGQWALAPSAPNTGAGSNSILLGLITVLSITAIGIRFISKRRIA